MDTKLDDIFNKATVAIDEIKSGDALSELDASALMAKVSVPYSHRRVASSYIILKDIFQYQIVQPRISNVEKSLLTKYGFMTLENSSITQINSEILRLKDWATSTDDILRNDANEILKIRVKELKFILSDNYSSTGELLNGYKALETYLTNIPKYYK